eukprot:gene11493-13405_t
MAPQHANMTHSMMTGSLNPNEFSNDMLSNTETFASTIDHLRTRKTEIITNISTPLSLPEGSRLASDDGVEQDQEDEQAASVVAIATLDGVLKLQRLGKGVVWKMEIEDMGSGQLIALYSVDVDKQSGGCIVACGWDGLTLVVDPNKNVVSFKFGDRVCAFTTGTYSLFKGNRTTCFVYVTFFGEIFVYYNISLSQVRPIHSLNWYLRQDIESLNSLLTATKTHQPITDIDKHEFYETLLSSDKDMLQTYLSELKSVDR